MRKSTRGFSLIELLIVVAIILIIAAIAIPDLLKSRQAAQQASAVGSLRTINTSEVTYSSTYTTGFSPSLVALDGSAAIATAAAAGLIDSVLGGNPGGVAANKSGYNFLYTANGLVTNACAVGGAVAVAAVAGTITGYAANASPIPCAPGNGNYYYTDQSGVIRMNNGAAAGPGDPPLAG